MKTMNLELVQEVKQAEELEKQGRLEEAAGLYEAAIRSKPHDELPYQRLMIIYRKLKQSKDELRVIKAGLSVFESIYHKKSRNKKLTALSNALMKSAGLSNSKGQPVYYPEPINKWRKRLELLQKKLKK